MKIMTSERKYDIIVVGAGHAGCEAALASARMGMKTAIFTINLDTIAQMSCNPAIGGLAKGQLVRELDALGGEMAKVIDKTGIHFRMLNKRKGPAVWSLRAQADKKAYQFLMKYKLENQENLDVKQGLVQELIVKEKFIAGIVTETGQKYFADAVILTPGTFLKGLIHIGLKNFRGGRSGDFPSDKLSDSLQEVGFKLQRFKTGTPARVDKNSIDFSKLTAQPGDETPEPFSFQTEKITQEQIDCYITYTNPKTHVIITDSLDRSPLYSGKISGTGPRYCPSIEDKVVRFPHKERHQIFLEPEGLTTNEIYCNGISTSLPEDVQLAFMRTIAGLENVKIMRPAYAIEYDYATPDQIKLTLETKKIENLYFAGQINGTSGYEEAAVQGFMAAVNAILKLRGKLPFILKRSEAYIGVLIDDLVTLGTDEPYRMFTSRAEYRLLLRQDNADERLMPYGYDLGLISESNFRKFEEKMTLIEEEKERLKETNISPKEINSFLETKEISPLREGTKIYDLLKRPEIDYDLIKSFDPERPELPGKIIKRVELDIKYEGYIKRQIEQVETFKKMEDKKIPENLNYSEIKGLTLEAQEKLNKIKPISIGQASRISGVSPADISVLLIHLKSRR